MKLIKNKLLRNIETLENKTFYKFSYGDLDLANLST